MPITAEQARAELRRRQAIAELQRRGVISQRFDFGLPPITDTEPVPSTVQKPPTIAPKPITPTEPAPVVAPEAVTGDTGRSAGQYGGITAGPVPIEERVETEKQEWLQQQMETGQIEPVPPTFWQKFKGDIPQMVGGTVGGLAGAKVGAMAGAKIPTGHPALKGATILGGATLGAGIGGMGGKGWQQYYRMKTRPTVQPMTLGEIYTEQAIAGIEEAAAELIGRGVVKVGGKLLAPVKKRLLPGAKGLAKQLLKRGAHLTPAQMTESRIIDTLEGIAESSFFGGGKLQRLKRIQQPQAFAKYIDDVVKQIGKGTRQQLTPEEIGDLLFDAIEGRRTIFKATAKAAYTKVDRLAGRAKVSLMPLKEFAKKKLTTAAARKGIGSTQAGDTLLKRVLQLDDVVTFKQAQALRSALLDERSAMAVTRDKAIGLAKRFIGLTDNAIQQGTKELSPEAYEAWRIANKFYRTGQTTFDSKIIRTLTKSLAENPEVAVKKIFRPGATRQIKVVKGLIDKKAWTTMKTAYLEQLLTESADVDKVVLGKSFLGKLNKIGDDTLKEIYNGQELASIKSIGKLGQLMQVPTGGSGAMLIQLKQAGAVVQLVGLIGLASTPFEKTSGFLLIAPPVMSRMLANPAWSKWLSVGMRLPRYSPQAAAIGTRIAKAAVKAEKQLNEEKRERRKKQIAEKVSKTKSFPFKVSDEPLLERLSLAKTGKELLGIFE